MHHQRCHKTPVLTAFPFSALLTFLFILQWIPILNLPPQTSNDASQGLGITLRIH